MSDILKMDRFSAYALAITIFKESFPLLYNRVVLVGKEEIAKQMLRVAVKSAGNHVRRDLSPSVPTVGDC
jgi:hypothetical protein